MKVLLAIVVTLMLTATTWSSDLVAPNRLQLESQEYKLLQSDVANGNALHRYQPSTVSNDGWISEVVLGQFEKYESSLSYALGYAKIRNSPIIREAKVDLVAKEGQKAASKDQDATVEKFFREGDSIEYSLTLVTTKPGRAGVTIFAYIARSNVSSSEALAWGDSHSRRILEGLKTLSKEAPEKKDRDTSTKDSVKLKGEYKEIDIARLTQSVLTLKTGTDKQKERLRVKIEKNPGSYAPPVLLHFANYLFEHGEEEDALFWLFAGQLRTQYDIARCTDKSVQDSIHLLNQQVTLLLRLLPFEDIDYSKEVLESVVEWDESIASDYDCRWIALHGIRVFLPIAADHSDPPLRIAENRWEEVAEENRTKFYDEYVEAWDNTSEEDLERINAKIEELRMAQ